MMITTKNNFLTFVFVSISLGISGCSTFDPGKFSGQFTPSQQVIETKKTKVIKSEKVEKKPVSKIISNNCDYIIRDLSVPNANTVFCIPKVYQ